MRAIWLVSRSNLCTLRSFVDDLSPQTDDLPPWCRNIGAVPSKLFIPERLKHLKSFDDEHQKSLYSPSVPIVFPLVPNSFPSVLSRKVYWVSVRMHEKYEHRKTAKQRMAKVQIEERLLLLRRTAWKQRRKDLTTGKELQVKKLNNVINQLS